MFSSIFTLWTILRIIFSIIFTLSILYLYGFINDIGNNEECYLSDGWRITNGKLFTTLLVFIGAINIIIPASKFLSGLPIIGSGYVLLFVGILFMTLFIVNRLAINITEDKHYDDENNICYNDKYSIIINWFSNRSILECLYLTILLSMIFFYL